MQGISQRVSHKQEYFEFFGKSVLMDVDVENVCVETRGDVGVSDEISDLECHYIEIYNRKRDIFRLFRLLPYLHSSCFGLLSVGLFDRICLLFPCRPSL